MANTSSEHIVSSYEDELTQLARLVSEMGGMVEESVTSATNALVRIDHRRAEEVVRADKKIDEMQRRIDELAVSMIARRQPMGLDLRQIISTIHVATDLERIGDMSKNIGRRTLEITNQRSSTRLFAGIRHMSELALSQINRALDSFTGRDADAAVEVCNRDDEVDAIYMSLFGNSSPT
jgi:phosphate transport system protein